MFKVVLIDDEPIIVEGLTKIIPWEKWDCEVVGVAYTGEEGLALIQEKLPHIVITDISMPFMDGLTMIASLKSQYHNMEIAILTGFRNFNYAQQAINLGVRRFLCKPSKMEELEEAIKIMTDYAGQKELKRIGHVSDEIEALDGSDESEDTKANSFIVKNAMMYIEEHYMEKLKLSEVADKVYVSQWHLSKLLNRHLGQNFSELLNNVRIQKAKELLGDPSLRIGDIAEEVGFLDIAHFSRVFKKQIGKSANEYRNTELGR